MEEKETISERARVLIADDDVQILKYLTRQLSQGGYLCSAVGDGESAIQTLLAEIFDVALIDLTMPRMNGLQVLAAMRKAGLDTIPIILTGSGDITNAIEAMKLGAFDFLEKPCNSDLLLNAVRRAGEYRNARRLARQTQALADQWQATFNASPDVLVITDVEGRIVRCNLAATARAGTAPDDIILKRCHEVLCGELHSASECPFEWPRPSDPWAPSEQPLWGGMFEITRTLLRGNDGKTWGCLVVARDVTERHRAETALRESEERHRVLFTSSRDAIMTLEPPSWRFTSANPACLRMFGAKDEAEFTSLGPWQVSPEFQPDGRPSAEAAWETIGTAMREGSAFFEWQHKRLDGIEFPASVLLARVDVREKSFLQATVRDITREKEAVGALRASEEKFRQIVDHIGLGVFLIAPDMKVLEMNKQARKWSPDVKLRDRPFCYEAFPFSSRTEPCCKSCPTAETFRDGQVHEELVTMRGMAGARTFKVVASPIHGDDQRVVAAIETIEDITQKLRIEHELSQAQKLEAIGRLAAGIAHEINSPTQYVGDNVEFLRDAQEKILDLVRVFRRMVTTAREGGVTDAMLSEARDLIKNAELDYLIEQIPRAIEQSIEGVGRISSIVQAMKEFSHPGTAEKTLADLNQCIRSTVAVSRNEWKYVADLETDLEEELPSVYCLPGEFNQVVLNLIVNAVHAIADVVGDGADRKGKILVSTRKNGEWVEIRISDTGTGIPEKIRDRVFEPFFTTKEVGRGTGQGLAIARNVIVDKHGGAISVDSEVGKRTTFTLRLPINAP